MLAQGMYVHKAGLEPLGSVSNPRLAHRVAKRAVLEGFYA